MQVTLIHSDGLHILTKATLSQLINDETLRLFADGLLLQALTEPALAAYETWTLAELLHNTGSSQFNGLLTALLVLDAEINAIINDKTRTFPLPGFLSYRHHLSPDKFPLNLVRLPPLNPDGHYLFTVLGEGHYLAIRLDLHPKLKVTGHVRIAISSPTRPPQRLKVIEHRLDRQELDDDLIAAAVVAQNKKMPISLTQVEQIDLTKLLGELIVS